MTSKSTYSAIVRSRILFNRASLDKVVALELIVLRNSAVRSALGNFLAGQPLGVAALIVNGLIVGSGLLGDPLADFVVMLVRAVHPCP